MNEDEEITDEQEDEEQEQPTPEEQVSVFQTVLAADDQNEDADQIEEPEPEPEPEPQPQPTAIAPDVTAARRQQLLEQASHLFDEDQLKWIEQYTEYRLTERAIQEAAETQQLASIGIGSDFLAKYKADMEVGKTVVPPELRGTPEGAMLQVTAALYRRMTTSRDVAGVLEEAASLLRKRQQPKQPQRQPPNPELVPGRSAGPRKNNSQPGSYLAQHFGLTQSELKRLLEG